MTASTDSSWFCVTLCWKLKEQHLTLTLCALCHQRTRTPIYGLGRNSIWPSLCWQWWRRSTLRCWWGTSIPGFQQCRWLIPHNGHCSLALIHWCHSVVERSMEGNATRWISNGHGLPLHTRNFNPIWMGKRHDWSWVYCKHAVSVIRNLWHIHVDNVHVTLCLSVVGMNNGKQVCGFPRRSFVHKHWCTSWWS